jgi:hypothetical protein
MATQVQLRRGTSAENDSFTGAQGELTYDTTNKRVRIHDGGTAGGFEIKTEDGSGNTIFADNEKAIFGAGSDLQIYHDGTNSYIDEQGQGNLFIRGANTVDLITPDGTEYMARFQAEGYNKLYHNGFERLETTSTGIQVTGNIDLPNSNPYILGSGHNIVQTDANTTYFYGGVNGIQLRKADNSYYNAQFSDNGAVIFNENGNDADFRVESDSNANMLLVDAGNNAVNIGNNDNAGGDLNVIGTATGNGVASTHRIVISSANQYGSNANPKNLRLDFVGYRDGAGDNGIKARINASETAVDGRATTLKFDVNDTGGNLQQFLSVSYADVVFNNPSNDMNFRIESDNSSSAFYVDAANDQVQFGTIYTEVTKIWFDNIESNDTYAFFGNNSSTTSNPPMFINRHASDGELIQFRRANVAAGSIRTNGGDITIGSSNTGLRFKDSIDAIQPQDVDAGAGRDNAIDLGTSSARFKNLYLSGGVYLGGDGADNLLDDYEEGIYNPTLTPTSGTVALNSSFNELSYTKIGRIVHITGVLTNVQPSSASGDLDITIPFTTPDQTKRSAWGAGTILITESTVTGDNLQAGQVILPYIFAENNNFITLINGADYLKTNNTTDIRISFTIMAL